MDEVDKEEEELRRFEEENFVRLDNKRLELEKKKVRAVALVVVVDDDDDAVCLDIVVVG